MCLCTPNMRTPFCGKPGCELPAQPRPTIAAPVLPAPPLLDFAAASRLDAIRRENHCARAFCAYEAGCVCWREFIAAEEASR